ncbi:low-density lipoprotein receptor class A domain-containing protein 2 [Boleophthalmus pectinirostris]|uniref:low-density lipoprotein receptor class A domain-containing protein 2 n=1 Tax=Boleophthalmus pectinirostris TaxID=150288 RepID=UPI0024330676|nr:low-density lipoprotein receptor class A domain-containing protein 2 [Boleophthalmus pectinirostris]
MFFVIYFFFFFYIFLIIYYFLFPVNVVDFCGQTIRADGMIVNSHQQSKKYYFVTMGTDCHITMQASSPKDNIQFYFRFFLVYSLLRVAPLSPGPTVPEPPSNISLEPLSAESPADRCHAGSYIQFYDGTDKSAPPLGPPLCGKSPPRPVLSTGNYLTLRLVTRGSQPRVDFVGDFTSFRLGFNQSKCNGEPYFSCRNGKCIPLSLVCDDKGIDNCGDGSDLEENLKNECKDGQRLFSNPLATTASPLALLNPSTTSQVQQSCAMPDSQGSISAPGSWSLLLCVVLGLVGGSVVFCWCCWSPGWFLWRVSICRFWPCCNSPCSACQLYGGSAHCKEHRMAKVSPHPQAKGPPTTAVNQGDEGGAPAAAAAIV